MFKTILLAAPLCLATLACHPEGDDVEPTTQRDAAMHSGHNVTIALGDSDLLPDQIHAIASHVETLGDVSQAKVKVKKTEAGTEMELEIWGINLPDETTLKQSLTSKFPVLASAQISVADLGTAPAHGGPDADLADEDPEVVKQEVIDRLRADGVEGDISVDVQDGEDGRKVEVRVEKTCDSDDDPDCN